MQKRTQSDDNSINSKKILLYSRSIIISTLSGIGGKYNARNDFSRYNIKYHKYLCNMH
jgi:hypothetical protein